MIIKKVYIKNFKNINKSICIDFENNLNLLVGPNGFGKTSIFDAIELCLTGKISRIEQLNNLMDSRRLTNTAPFFLNNVNEDSLLKLWIMNDENESLVIVRHYQNNPGSKQKDFLPQKSLTKFKAYKGTTDDFVSDSNIFELDALTQNDIDKFLQLEDGNYQIDKLYNLFNYIHQDVADYYIKKPENSRKSMLDFLIQVHKYSDKESKLKKIHTQFNSKISILKQKRAEHVIQGSFDSSYRKLPLNSKREFSFNQEEISFNNNSPRNSYQEYQIELDKLKEFKMNFSPVDYSKMLEQKRFHREVVLNTELIDFIMFQDIVSDNQLSNQIINNSLYRDFNFQKHYVLQNVIEQFEYYEQQLNLQEKIQSLLQMVSVDVDRINFLEVSEVLKNIKYSDAKIASFLTDFKDYNELINNLEKIKIERINISDLRHRLITHQFEHDGASSICSLCGFDWKSNENLENRYQAMNEYFENGLNLTEKTIQSKLYSCRNHLKEIKIYANDELNNLNVLDKRLMNEISTVDFQNPKYETYEKMLSENTFVAPLELNQLTWSNYQQTLNKLRTYSENQLFVSADIFSKFMKSGKNKVTFSEKIKQCPLLENKDLEKYKISKVGLFEQTRNYKTLFENLQRKLLEVESDITFNHLKSSDSESFYSIYFDSDKQLFDDCTLELLNEKKEYISFQFYNFQSKLLQKIDGQLQKLTIVERYLNKQITYYQDVINEYQHEMIQKIKLPFYLYSSKILQNYQQGFGIFISSNETSTNLRFVPSSITNQDAVFQLSAGQIAVMSIAFTLSLNTTFKLSNTLGLLIIDDPIQDMDAMNIYAFIDILRHSLKNYQVIMSTHNDTTAMFIKYKFNLMEMNTKDNVNLIDIKSVMLN